MPQFIAYLLGEVAVIAQAPVTFFTVLIAVAVIMYFVVRHQFADRLASSASSLTTANERVKLADERVADYKEKLEGRSPDEAGKLIAALEKRLTALEPRALTAEQIAAMKAVLAQKPHSITVIQDAIASDAQKLSVQLQQLFTASGWKTETGIAMGIGFKPRSGIAIITGQGVLPADAMLVWNAFQVAGVAVDLQQQPSRTGDVELLLTTPSLELAS